MAMPRKNLPLHKCKYCGKVMERKRLKNGSLESWLHYNRRKYCDRSCMASSFDSRDNNSTDYETCHYHARKIKPEGPCEQCGSAKNVDVHHIDHDFTNNDPSNLKRLCRSCHIREHRHRTCSICGANHKAYGYCSKHYQRFKRYGDPYIVAGRRVEE